MTHRHTPKQSGFTLVEVIAAIVVVAVFSAIMLVLLSDSFIKSMDSVRRFTKSSAISEVMANIMMDYEPYPKWKPLTTYSATSPANKVFPTRMNKLFYICTNSGTSGSIEPQWRDGKTQDGGTRWEAGKWKAGTAYVVGDLVIPTTPNGNFYRCTGAGTSVTTEPTWPVKSTDPAAVDGPQWVRLLEYLRLQIGSEGSTQDNNYGKYNVVKNRFVKFVSNATTPVGSSDPEDVLEVQIRNEDGDTLTTLFTTQIN